MAEVAASVEIVPSKGDADGSRLKEYEAMYQYSITRPEEFWAKVRRPFLSLTRKLFSRARVRRTPCCSEVSRRRATVAHRMAAFAQMQRRVEMDRAGLLMLHWIDSDARAVCRSWCSAGGDGAPVLGPPLRHHQVRQPR